jgi:hypothetical protein
MSVTKVDPAVRRTIFDIAQHRHDPEKYQCNGCRKYFPYTALQVDHITPEAESTPEDRRNPDNFQLLCAAKGSTWRNSCHKRKTREEHRRRARKNRPARKYGQAMATGALAIMSTGYTWEEIFRGDHEQAVEWLQQSGLSVAGLFSIYMVQKLWRRRRPRRRISAKPVLMVETESHERLDTSRIIEGAREIIGQRGTVQIIGMKSDQEFTLVYTGTGFADHDDEQKFALLQKIQAKIGDRWLPTWNTTRDQVRFVRRPALERMIHHPGLQARPWHILPISPTMSFDLLVTPHILIVGTTGAGKTALMRTLIAAVADSAARDDSTKMILADPKLIEMPGFEGWAGVSEIVGETQELWDMAFELRDEMFNRLRLIRAGKAKTKDFKKIIVVIDEYEQYFKRMDSHWRTGKDDEGKPLKSGGQRVPGAIDAIQTVLSLARKVNIHLIIGTQSPDANWFGGTGTRENMSGRAAVGPVDSYRARMMFDDASVGRDIPIEFKGRATIQVGNGPPQETQIYYTADPFDPDDDNTKQDWATLLTLGMPTKYLPDKFKELAA